ncbi:MAG: sulfotransferase [Streptosporangiaceae bacterium]
MSLIIVVGTGRCGSTMLTRLLRMHPEVLSIGEFWNCFLDNDGCIPTHEMSGEEFWQRLTKPASSYDSLVRAGIKTDDYLEPFPSRFDYVTGMPPLCRVLARLTGGSPDPLYDELAPEVSAWPRRSAAEHCRALFADLAARLGRRVIVERSGGSLSQLELLAEMFPEARFVFLHRNGPDAVLSMSRYPTFRLSALRGLAEVVAVATPEELEPFPAEIKTARPEDFKGLTEPPFDQARFLAFPIPLPFFGWLWSKTTRTGTIEIRRVPPDRWMTLRYEQLLKDPRAELAQLASFIGVPADQQWLDSACKNVDSGRSGSAASHLHPGDLAPLRAACAAGARAFDVLESEHH